MRNLVMFYWRRYSFIFTRKYNYLYYFRLVLVFFFWENELEVCILIDCRLFVVMGFFVFFLDRR